MRRQMHLPVGVFLAFIMVAPAGNDVSAPSEPHNEVPADFDLLLVAWLSPWVRNDAMADGWVPIPLLTHRFHYNEEEDSFDPVRYFENIWDPNHDPNSFVPGSVVCEYPEGLNWEKCGVPTDDEVFLYEGWADIDFERYGPVRYPEDYPHDADRIKQSYIDLAITTKYLRPNSRIILHGLVNDPGSEQGRANIEEITGHYDAVSPSVFPRFTEHYANLPQVLQQLTERLQFCRELKQLHGVEIVPVVLKRFFPLDNWVGYPLNPDTGEPWRLVMPVAIQRAILDVIFTFDIDGILVFNPDGRNVFRVDPQWPPDTPNGDAVNEATRNWLNLIEEYAGNTGEP